MKWMLGHLGFRNALASAGLPPPGSKRGYAPEQLITLDVDSTVMTRYGCQPLQRALVDAKP